MLRDNEKDLRRNGSFGRLRQKRTVTEQVSREYAGIVLALSRDGWLVCRCVETGSGRVRTPGADRTAGIPAARDSEDGIDRHRCSGPSCRPAPDMPPVGWRRTAPRRYRFPCADFTT